MTKPDVPDWVLWLPPLNASLNGVATVLLLLGWWMINRGKRDAHKRTMLGAFAVSAVFLACYLVYHGVLKSYTGSGSKAFTGVGLIRPVYYSILISHVFLAFFVAVLAPLTIWKGLAADKAERLGQPANWAGHCRIAKVTFPIWVYVSVTGVVIYFLAYHWPSS